MILKVANLLDYPDLCKLADEETPTATSAQLDRGQQNVNDDEEEDLNDISSIYKFVKNNSISFALSASCGLPFQFNPSSQFIWCIS